MEIEQKYEEFSQVVLREAHELQRKQLSDIEAEFETQSKEYKDNVLAKAEKMKKFEYDKRNRDKSRILIEANMETRHILNETRNELTEKIFESVENELKAFLDTDEYKNMLLNQAQEAKNILGEKFNIFITEHDMKYKSDLEKLGAAVFVTDEPIIGGILAKVDDKPILVNYSLKNKLAEEKEKFNAFKIM